MNLTRTNPSQAASPDLSTSDDPRLLIAVREYQAALDAGVPPARDEFLARFPEIAAELAECLDALELVNVAAHGMRNPQANAAPAPPDFAEHQRPLGDFRIVSELGRGGMGVVYEAVQLSLGRRVALKVLPLAAAFDAVHLERFKNEAQAAARLHHSNIVPVHAVGSDRGMHYYAMQLIDGRSLATVIGQLRAAAGKPVLHAATSVWRKPSSWGSAAAHGVAGPIGVDDNTLGYLPPQEDASPSTSSLSPSPGAASRGAAEIETLVAAGPTTVLDAARGDTERYHRTVAAMIRQAALALEHAHQFGVVHRDIKPANLLLDQRGNLWVTDFGLAQLQTAGHLTQTGDMLGTLRYMSPEQAIGDRVLLDHRTDIYSLGVTLYELLTLEPAFGDSQRQVLLRQIIDDEPAAPRSQDPNIPRELETIVLKAIAKSPADRYPTAQALADDLQRWLDDQPIVARRPTLLEHAARWRRRHRGVMRAGIGFLFLALLGLLVSTVLIAREHAETKAAYDREIQQRAAAEESFRQARAAVDDFAQLGEEELANMPSMLGLRRRMLETALAYYQSFLEQREDDPSIRADLAATSTRVAHMVDELSLIEAFSPLMLLADDSVQAELGLSDEQVEKIDAAFALFEEESDSEASEDDEYETPGHAQLARARDEIVAQLEPAQKSRLDQLALQQRGPFAFRDRAVAEALKLSEVQREQIARIIEEERPRGPDGALGRGPWRRPPHRRDVGPPGNRPDEFDGPPRRHPPADREPPLDGVPERPDGGRPDFDRPRPPGPPPRLDGPRRPEGPPRRGGRPRPDDAFRPEGAAPVEGPPAEDGRPGDGSPDFTRRRPPPGPPPAWDDERHPAAPVDGEGRRPRPGLRGGPRELPGEGPRPPHPDGPPPGEPRPGNPDGRPHGPGPHHRRPGHHGPDERTIERIMDVLTPEQRETWKSMIGEPLEPGHYGPPEPGDIQY